MTPTAQPYGDKWLVRSMQLGTTTSTVGGRTTVNERAQFWTGSEWHDDPSHAKAFGSQEEVNEYIEANRDILEC